MSDESREHQRRAGDAQKNHESDARLSAWQRALFATKADIIVTKAGTAIIVRADLRMRLATTWGREQR